MSDRYSLQLFLKPVLLLLAVLLVLLMLRLGVWQLDRAEQKQVIVTQRETLAQQPETDLDSLLQSVAASELNSQRYRRVNVQGRFLDEPALMLDGRVQNSRVGYDVYNLFETEAGHLVLVKRGWIYAGSSRADLPAIPAPDVGSSVQGRLNVLAPAPPMWDARYPPQTGQVWQYFPLDDLTARFGQNLLPMVIELPPTEATSQLSIEWVTPDDSSVAVHRGYAFQWFSMAAAFAIACVVLLVKSVRRG